MIRDEAKRNSIVAQWHTVRRYQGMMKTNALGAFANGATLTPEFINGCNTLVLIFAFGVLERALRVLLTEAAYPPPEDERPGFKALMLASQASLPWVAFECVSEGLEERHKASHGLKIVARADCWKYIDAVEGELVAWGLLAGPVVSDHAITRGKAE